MEPWNESYRLIVLIVFVAIPSLQDGIWGSAAATVKVEIDGETREVHLEECNGVGWEFYNLWVHLS